jgi:glycosyltransferase involved in cell wall biosynthesis
MKSQCCRYAIRQCCGSAIPTESSLMRVLIATDAWHPQVNGVVRTLTSLSQSARRLGVVIEFLTPEGFPDFQAPTYPGLRLALPRAREIARRIEAAEPDAIHIATEGPIGYMARAYCRRRGRRFTTSYTTRFPEYISARVPVPQAWIYAALRRFHAAAAVTMVATPSLMTELAQRGFANLGMWTRGVDTDLFRPDRAVDLDFARPIFVTMGRLAVEKNLEAFLSLDLPGTKVVIGTGPQEGPLQRRFPDAKFLGLLENGALVAHLAAADVFVFPSRTDTFGVVQLEALACGLPVAAFPVMGPKDVVAGHPVGVLNDDLRVAALDALKISRQACRAFALERSWENSARQFIAHVQKAATGVSCQPEGEIAMATSPHGGGARSAGSPPQEFQIEKRH